MSEWRSCLRQDEEETLAVLDALHTRKRAETAEVQKARKAIINRAIQRNIAHLKKGVDMDAEHT